MRLAAATAVLVLAAACGSPAPGPNITGFGATISAWNRAHTQTHNYAGFPAYGPSISTPQGKTPQFTQVMSDGGRVTQFIEVLPKNSTLSTAEKAALAQLPSGTAPKALVVTGSCAFWNLSSATLKSAVGSPFVAVEMSYEDASGSPFWLPNTVNTMTFQTGKGQTNDVC
jgi:hypothetical protein